MLTLKEFKEARGVLSGVIDRYLNIQELTPEILHEFVERILVHERSEGRKKKGLGRFLF